MADTVKEGSSSSPFGSTPRWIYHVFLNFRGEDTRKGFIDHLFAALERKGITTFKDDKDLETGQVIPLKLLKAIEESLFAITVISPNYASSTFCLDELQKIVECNKIFGLGIVPIFYDVEPSDVRHQRGSFSEAFKKHEENFPEDKEKLQRWRDALTQVANYAGWDSKDQREATLVENIVEYMHKKLIPKLPSSKENLVGIAAKVKEVISIIGMELNDVRFIGIWGMGGIGKTTIARAVYEEIRDEFKVSCFLANIKEVSESSGLIHLQKELLSHLDIRSSGIHNLYDGINTIRNSLCNKKVLLVLDDVSEISQLENLAGKQYWFGPGSRVIITTRDMHPLRIHGVQNTYKVGELVQNEALHLFCLKAFKQDQPEAEYLDLSKEVIEYSGGLPLALEVLGSYLHGRPIDAWRSALRQIKNVPHTKILDKLKISYEGLNAMEKNMFLDISCFFKGMLKDKVITIMKNYGDFPEIGIDVLIERSLVTLDWWNRLEMHDLLQELGRHIVFQESPNHPGRRSRLWFEEDINYVLTMNAGTEEIEGVAMSFIPSYEARWSTEAFSKTNRLKYLHLNAMQLPLGLNCLPSSLKVLHWRGCPLKTLPFRNQSIEIFDLELHYSQIEKPWHGTKFLENLKYMDLSNSKNLKQLSDFSGAPNLEKLVLEGCTSLIDVHTSLLCHKQLVLLNLRGCKSLKSLGSKLEMSSLKELILSGCSTFKSVPDFGESMKYVSILSLERTAIRTLPTSLGCLVGLTHLALVGCKNLVSIPDTICNLKSLINIELSGCSKLSKVPEGFLQETLHLDMKELSTFEHAVMVLDIVGSRMTNLYSSIGFMSSAARKGNKISVLAFEAANTIVKGASLMQSLSEKNIRHLKEVVLRSEGVQNLISRDMDELLRIAAADKREELKIFSGEVVRFGNRCVDPQWHFLDRYFENLGLTLTPQKQLKEETDIVMQQLMTLVQYTAELYHELHVLDRCDQDYWRKLQEDNSNATQRGDSLTILRAELKIQKKHVRNLKKKSLWSRILEEVMEKLVDIVHFLHLKIHEAFGSADNDVQIKDYHNHHKKLGSAGLALHYANIITQIDTLVSCSSSVPPKTRDALYQALPHNVKSTLRLMLPSLQVKEELTVPQIKAEMERTLQWLVPIATNTRRAHHVFGSVGEWANTGSGVNHEPAGMTDLLRIETLHHADKDKTESYILELILWLHQLVARVGFGNLFYSSRASSFSVDDFYINQIKALDIIDRMDMI